MVPEPLDQLRLRQVTAKLEPFADIRKVEAPREGWIRVIRKALGMTGRQLARRLGVSQAAVSQYEKAESDRSITLGTLQTVAAALECEVVYALVPRPSLQTILEKRAHRIATRMVGRVSRSMRLEEQAVSSEEDKRQIEDLTRQILFDRPRNFWDDSDGG